MSNLSSLFLLIGAAALCYGLPDIEAAEGGCPDDWYKLDSKCYSLGGISEAMTWSDARAWCSINGPANGDLAVIYHPGLQSFLTAISKAFPVDMWVGLSTGSSNTFEWTDGSSLTYTKWAPDQPEGGPNKCVKLLNDPDNPGDWDDVACVETNAFLCESDLDPTIFNNISIITQCQSEEYQSYFDSCFRVETTPATFEDALTICQSENAELASFTDRYQEAFAKTVLYNNALESMWIGLAREQGMPGGYTWQDGWPLTFTSWDMYEPTGEGCVVLTSDETWNDTTCTDERPFICKYTLVSQPPSPTPKPGYCPGGWERHGDSCYLVDSNVRATSWSQAEMACQDLYGSHLASTHSDEERDFFKDHAENLFEATSVWIGMEITMGELQWTDGSVVNYVDWLSGQPAMDSCVEMDLLNGGGWKTDDCNDNSPYFCQVPVFDYEDGGCPPDWYKLDNKCYTLAGQSDPATWQDARQWCMDNSVGDGDLATVYVAGLQSFLTAILKAFPVDVWIGLYTNSTDTNFQWADGSAITYTSWADGQPEGGLNKCVRMLNDPSNPGNWDDDECTEMSAFLCQSNLDPGLPGNPDVISNCGREGYQSYFDSCFRVETKAMTFDMAMQTCQDESAQLASFSDRYQEAFAQTVLYNNRLESMWIGLMEDEFTGEYLWLDAWPLTFTSWGMDEPSGEGCVTMTNKEYWNDTSCTDVRPFICKYTAVSPPSPPLPKSGYCPSGWEQRGSYCYLFDNSLSAASWSDAHDDCQSKYGSDLASVHNNAEEDFIREHAGSAFTGSAIWLGMEKDMYMLKWSDQSLVNYVNWMDGQPGMDDCVEMDISGPNGWSTNDCAMNSHYVCKSPVFTYEEAGCPLDWYKLDKKCYTLAGQTDPKTWQDAQQWCVDNSVGNGNLATVYVAGLQSFLTAILKAFPVDVWIGLYTDDADTAFKWADGSMLSYTSWVDGQPDGNTTTQCVKMINEVEDPGNWDDVECMETNMFLCQSDPDPALPGNPDVISNCGRDGYQSYFDSCFRVETTPMTYDMAMEVCHNETAQLASFSDRYQEAFAKTVLYNNGLESMWIGLVDNQLTGEYEWQDGWPLTFTSWGMNEPSGEGCVALTNEETWDDTSCTDMRPFICKYTSQSPPPEPTPPTGYCPSGWEHMDGSCYLFDASVSAMSWHDAQDDCQKKYGASLASIHNVDEKEFVRNGAGAAFQASTVWIGMQRDMDDILTWTDQSLVNYVNWVGGQPGMDDCVEMDVNGQGGWSTNACSNSSPYVCKIPVFDYAEGGCPPDWYKLDKMCYTLAGQTAPLTWQDARQWCMDNSVGDGDLATVYVGGIQSLLTAILKAYPVDVWIGLYNTNINPDFQWADGSPLTYTSWADGQPDGMVGTGYCVKMVNEADEPGNWDDIPCNEANAFLCQSSPDPNLPGNPDVISNCARKGYQSYFDSCFRVETTPMTYDMAMEACHNETAQLAFFTDRYQEAFAQTVLYNNRLESMWIGLKHDETTGQYQWPEGWPLTFTSWGMNEPSGEGCVALTNEETWDDTSCTDMRPFICKYTSATPPPAPTPATGYCPDNWEYFDGFCYHFDPNARATSYTNAHQECQNNFGATLTSIHSNAEQEYIMSKARDLYPATSLWIGMQLDNEGSVMWDDSSLVNYVKWMSGQPGMGNCVEMDLHHGGEWRTDDCMDNSPYVCKAPVFGDGGGCLNGWYKLNDRCFYLGGQSETDKVSWQEAQDVCMAQGGMDGNLASIQIAGYQSFLTAILKGIVGDVWIGLSNSQGLWTWVDGTQVVFENWADGQPDSGANQCGKLANDITMPGEWVDVNCGQENAYLCQTAVDPTLPGNPDIISQCGRPGYQSYFQSCFRVVTEAKTFSEAQAYCVAESANLASLNDMYEEGYAESVLYNNQLESAWIGLQADMDTGRYEWLDGWPLTFTKWRVNEPSKVAGKGCVALSNNPNSSWVDERCDEVKGFVCKYTFASPPPEPPVELGYCPSGWELYQGHCYKFRVGQMPASWDEAQYECQTDYGSHLAYLHSDDEVAYVLGWLNDWGVDSTWLGLRRDYESGLFEWTNQDLVDYVNWMDEPSNPTSCVEMVADSSGSWKERGCTDLNNYVCKMKQMGPVGGCPNAWYKLRDKCYRLYGGPDDSANVGPWYLARDQCAAEERNGHLATINNSGLQAFLTAILKGLPGDVWMGLSTVGQIGSPREFGWDDGTPFNYSNWNPGQPDGVMDSDNCVKIVNNPDDPGTWDDVDCLSSNSFLCESDLDPIAPANPPIISRCLRDDYQSYISNCFKIVLLPATFSEAVAGCAADGTQLASFSDKYEQAFAQTVLYSNGVSNMWMGLSSDEASGNYMWTDDWPLTFTNWGVNEPSGESCVKFTNTAAWEADDCGMELPYMCKFTLETKPTSPPVIEGYCPPGWNKWGSDCYWAKESAVPGSWEESQAICQSNEGSNLLCIHTHDENAYIQELATVTWGRASVWLGMNRNDKHVFEWTDDSPVDYVNWSPDEPNGLNVGENCVEYNSETGTWNDEDCNDYSTYICKLPQRMEAYPPTEKPGPPNVEPTQPEAQLRLKTGEIFGIALACFVVILVFLLAAYFLCIKDNSKGTKDAEAHPNVAYDEEDEEGDEKL